MFPIGYYLGISVTELLLQLLSIVGNGFICLLFMRFHRLCKSNGLRLIFLLSLSDAVFAILSIPQIAYFVRKWNPIMLDYDPLYAIIANIPLTIQLKMHLLITLSIAIDRYQAIKHPSYYRYKNHRRQVITTMIMGLIFGCFDVFLELFLTNNDKKWQRSEGCVAGGCFTSNSFQTYWGLTNMLLGIIGIIFTAIVAIELKKFRTKNKLVQWKFKSNDGRQLVQANRLAMAILVISMIFTMFPSLLVGTSQAIGLSMFKNFGPFYTFCLLCAGVLNSIIAMSLNQQIRRAFVAFWTGKSDILTPITTQVSPTAYPTVHASSASHFPILY